MKTYAVTITERGQMTLPAEVRRQMGVNPGDKVLVVVDGDEIRVQPVKWTIQSLAGSVKPLRPIEDMDQAIREAVEEHVDRFMEKYLRQ